MRKNSVKKQNQRNSDVQLTWVRRGDNKGWILYYVTEARRKQVMILSCLSVCPLSVSPIIKKRVDGFHSNLACGSL